MRGGKKYYHYIIFPRVRQEGGVSAMWGGRETYILYNVGKKMNFARQDDYYLPGIFDMKNELNAY